MEGNIVFAHELNKLNLFRVAPPLAPFRSVVSSDGNITNRSIKPNIEHFISIALVMMVHRKVKENKR